MLVACSAFTAPRISLPLTLALLTVIGSSAAQAKVETFALPVTDLSPAPLVPLTPDQLRALRCEVEFDGCLKDCYAIPRPTYGERLRRIPQCYAWCHGLYRFCIEHPNE